MGIRGMGAWTYLHGQRRDSFHGELGHRVRPAIQSEQRRLGVSEPIGGAGVQDTYESREPQYLHQDVVLRGPHRARYEFLESELRRSTAEHPADSGNTLPTTVSGFFPTMLQSSRQCRA